MTISHSIHRLFTPESRRELSQRDAAYWARFARGRSIGYRRGVETGSWFSRVRLREGRDKQSRIGQADDDLPANGETILSFPQALAAAELWCAQYDHVAIDLCRAYEKEHCLPELSEPPPFTVAHAMVDYLEWLRDNKVAFDRVFYQARAHILPSLGHIPVDELTAREIRKWMIEVSEKPPRAHTAPGKAQQYLLKRNTPDYVRKRQNATNKVLAYLKAGLNRAFDHGKVEDDAAWTKVRGFRRTGRRRSRFLEKGEIQQLIAACQLDLALFVSGALLTGCRVSELQGMQVQDFSVGDGRVFVTDAKSKEHRAISLSHEGLRFFAALTQRRSAKAYMFLRRNGTRWKRGGHWRLFQDACVAAGINPPIRFHDLRHTYASQSVMAGVPMKVVSTQLGHVDTRMVDRFYGRVGSAYIDEVVQERLPDFLPSDIALF